MGLKMALVCGAVTVGLGDKNAGVAATLFSLLVLIVGDELVKAVRKEPK